VLSSDEDENSNPSGSQTYRRLREIADLLGKPVGTFLGSKPDEDVALLELLRLWGTITDPVGRRRVLDLARQEAKCSNYEDDS
jgi:hypothetical protein